LSAAAAFAVALSILPKMPVTPSLTFFPATPPTAPPAAAPEYSTSDCAPKDEPSSMTQYAALIFQYLKGDGNRVFPQQIQVIPLIPLTKLSQHHWRVGAN
jgi:hypothetical protein